ncbi:MAG: FAD:protein FMN transferase [Thermoguttaceae bacterium]|nr:FAD:protein FMN transferase [Thermoguttaceae bacterium]
MAADSQNVKKIAADSPEKQSGSSLGTIIRFGLIAVLVGVIAKPYLFKTSEPAKAQSFQIAGETMGTVWTATVCADAQTLTEKDLTVDAAAEPAKSCEELLQRFIQKQLDAVDLAASTFKPESDISRFNASQSTEWFPVSETTAQIVQIALDVAQKTGGAFDPTVAPLVDLYRFGPNKAPLVQFPSDANIAKRLENVGYNKLEVRLEPEPALRKSVPGLTLDLSGVAKGFAVDRVAQALEDQGLTDYLVEVGGETRCGGQKTRFDLDSNALVQTPWRLGIEAPEIARDGQRYIPRPYRAVVFNSVVPATPASDAAASDSAKRPNTALATSGDYHNYRQIGDLRFSHIVDPRSGKPTEIVDVGAPAPGERLGAVSVVAENCAEADAFATAFFVLGEKEGIALADKLGVAVLYVFRSDDSALEIRDVASQAFQTNVESELLPSDAPADEPATQEKAQSDAK